MTVGEAKRIWEKIKAITLVHSKTVREHTWKIVVYLIISFKWENISKPVHKEYKDFSTWVHKTEDEHIGACIKLNNSAKLKQS